MASAVPNHLTAEETNIEYATSRCFLSTIVVGEVCRASSFCKHTTSTRRVPYSVTPNLARSQYAQLGHNIIIG